MTRRSGCTISLAVGFAAVALAPCASADVKPLSPPIFDSDHKAYLRQLHYDEIPLTDDLMAVEAGEQICLLLREGYSENYVKFLWDSPEEIAVATADMYIKSAVTYLCRDEGRTRPQLVLPTELQHGRDT